MQRHSKQSSAHGAFYGFAISWIILSLALPLYKVWGILLTIAVSSLVALIISGVSKKRAKKAIEEQKIKELAEAEAAKAAAKKSYGPDIDPILEESNRALSEMGRIYISIKDLDIRKKINELMRITDKISQDAIADPSDIPQIRKFFNYYLPTTIKLLNTYDRMSSQGIEGENLNRSMKSIDEMLDEAISAYKKRLDSLFANQALDIEADIHVMNTMLAREGLSNTNDFEINE